MIRDVELLEKNVLMELEGFYLPPLLNESLKKAIAKTIEEQKKKPLTREEIKMLCPKVLFKKDEKVFHIINDSLDVDGIPNLILHGERNACCWSKDSDIKSIPKTREATSKDRMDWIFKWCNEKEVFPSDAEVYHDNRCAWGDINSYCYRSNNYKIRLKSDHSVYFDVPDTIDI